MYESFQKAKRGWRGGAILCLSLFLSAGLLAAPASAAGVSQSAPVSSARMLVPVGHTVGIKLFSRGVLVVKLSDGGSPAKTCGLQTGDVILKCGGVGVTSTEQFQALLQEGGGQETDLQVRRGSSSVTLGVEPTQNDAGSWSIGAWIRDSMAGIGTMTFYDPASGVFGALGHGITDVDTALLMPFSSGSILPSTVKAVKRGEAGAAGELRGDFDLTRDLGALYANTDNGIFGVADSTDFTNELPQALPVADPSGVKAGKATILSNVKGDEVREYEVEIVKVFENAADGRELLLSVTDPDLIAATGGIVQGMGVSYNRDNTGKP